MVKKTDIDGLPAAVAALKAGFLIAFPTDTVYGVAADPRVEGAREKLYEAKKREPRKPVPVLISNSAVAEKWGGAFSNAARLLSERFWPGPVTLVLPVGESFEGFRVPRHPVAMAILEAAGGALYTTSANLSGQPPVGSAQEAQSALAPFVRAILEGRPHPSGRESTVVKVVGEQVVVLREGAVPKKEIEACVNKS